METSGKSIMVLQELADCIREAVALGYVREVVLHYYNGEIVYVKKGSTRVEKADVAPSPREAANEPEQR